MPEPSNASAPRPLKPSEALVLEYLREHAAPDGCARYGRAAIAGALGLAGSTAQTAIAGLRELGLLGITKATDGGSNIYCVEVTDLLTDADRSGDRLGDRSEVTDGDRLGDRLGDRSVPVDAPPHASAQPRRARAAPPPTPMDGSTATGCSDPLASASAQPPAPTREAEVTDSVPIGELAGAAAAEAAKLAGRELDPAVRGRLGRAAQKVAGEHSVAEVLDAARRIGEGAGDDLYTALRAVQRGAPMPPTVRADADARYADLQRRAELSREGRDPLWLGRLKPGEIVEAEALYVGTYGERRRFDAELWARELGSFPIGAILWGIRAMAKASPHPPTWGEVAAAAGPTLEHERRKRQNRLAVQREDERIEARG
jgi:hypothetical protein